VVNKLRLANSPPDSRKPASESGRCGRLGTLPSAEDVPSLAELARWSSPQPAVPIMATMWSIRYSAAATLSNYRSLGWTSPAALLSNVRLVLRSILPTGPILWMRERPHGLAAQPSTARSPPVIRRGSRQNRPRPGGPIELQPTDLIAGHRGAGELILAELNLMLELGTSSCGDPYPCT
jgi:hypothetical protein